MKINIGTPMKDGNVYFIDNGSTDEDGKEFEAFHLNNVNTEKDQDQKFIWKEGRWEDKIPVSKNNLKLNYLINAEKKDNKQAQHPKDGGSFLIENIKLMKAKEIKLQPTVFNLNHMRSGEKNEKGIIDLIENSGYIVVDKSKDNASKDEIYKTHKKRMMNNHEENGYNNMNSEESST